MPTHEDLFAPVRVVSRPRPDGGRVLSSEAPLGVPSTSVGHDLERWAREAPSRVFLAEGDAASGVRSVTYREAVDAVHSLAQALLDRGLSAERPLVLLSDNGIDHALLTLAAMHVGVPAVPLSPAYSLLSSDLAKLSYMAELVRPGAVYAASGVTFARALANPALAQVPVITSVAPPPGAETVDDLRRTSPTDAVARAFSLVGPDTVAKILFTSGSTGAPKGVLNTQRMLTANQQAIAQVWPFLSRRPPVVVDWLPWSHTFGGNHNFHMVLRHGGTLFVDAGKPAPGLVERTVWSLRTMSPTVYFNVPRGFDVLLPYLERDADLREALFRDLDVLFYAAAALPQSTWERLERVAELAGKRVPLTSAWGSTETAPLVTSVHFRIERAGNIGVPAPGCEVALVPVGDRHELRVRGPGVTPGYFRDEAATVAAFDEEGFFRMGDAGKLADPDDPSKGVVFDGRLSENFKLGTGTWVSVGELRVALVAACAPLVADCVLAGHDGDAVSLLVFPSLAGAVDLVGEKATFADVAAHPTVRARLAAALAAHNAENPAATRRIARAMILAEPPSIDGGEITDKGYVNQRAVLSRRSALVSRLVGEHQDDDVIVP